MRYLASVRVKGTNQIKVVESTEFYGITNKKEFAKALRDSDYAVRFISTPENFDADCDKYYAKLEDARVLRKCVKEAIEESERRFQESKEVAQVEAITEAPEEVKEVEALIDITDYNLHWNNPLNAPKTLSLRQIKELYNNGNFLFDNDILSPVTFSDASIKIVASVICCP